MPFFGRAMDFFGLTRFRSRIPSAAIWVLLLLCGISPVSHGSKLFDADTVLDASLIGPLSSILQRTVDRQEQAFVLRVNGIDHAVAVRVRGKSRLEVCSFPPLRLRFVADDSTDTVFEGQSKLKLVTHCRRGDAYQTSVLREYAAYRIFNVVSEVGYRVRLLRITYIDTEGSDSHKSFEQYAYLIEPAAELAIRVNGIPVDVTGITLKSLDHRHAATVFIFQYLIGNIDWSLVMADADDTCCHNSDLFDIGNRRYCVPYDFDLSRFVNARYARRHPFSAKRHATRRQYRGYCVPGDALQFALRYIKERQHEILDVVDGIPALSASDRDKSVEYLQEFFDRADDEDRLLASFERYCL